VSHFPTSGPEACQYSDVEYIRGLPWKICAWGNEVSYDDDKYLLKSISFILECNTENTGIIYIINCQIFLPKNLEDELYCSIGFSGE
jgi:hypothetical protein